MLAQAVMLVVPNQSNMIKKIIKLSIFVAILIIALLVRKANYAQVPVPGQSVDEYSYSWVGLSLIETGMPVGISGIPGYKNIINRYINVDRFFQVVSTGDPLTLNYPWMDHPPLLGLITGGYAYLSGARVFEDTTALLIRRPIIIIGVVSVALAFIFCWLNFGYLSAVLVGSIYATTPLVVLSSRMIQAENAIIPCLLFTMIALSQYFRSKKDFWLLLVSLSSGLATLFKLSGFVCHLLVFFSLIAYYKSINKSLVKDLSFFLIISLPITFLYIIYGLSYDPQTLKNILFSNYNRFYGIGPSLIFDLITRQRLTQHKFLPEVWIIMSWFILFFFLLKKRINISQKISILAPLSYLVIYILFGSQPYGWYAFPFWPLLFILLAQFLSSDFQNLKHFLLSFIILVTIFGENIFRIIGVGGFQPYASIWRLSLSGLLLTFIFLQITKVKFITPKRIVLLIIFLLSIYTNIKYLQMINIDFWWQNVS